MPSQQDIINIKRLISMAFHLLRINDTDLVNLGDSEVIEYDSDAETLERKLHEICINHRLAYYIEQLMPEYFSNEYKVDLEYNRYYKNKKYLRVKGNREVVRPDIIIHTRADKLDYPQHLLIIEAKKDVDSPGDADVVKSFLTDPKYCYVFGLTVRYNDFNPIKATLFYKDENNNILSESLQYPV